jgi:hypothetical protein
VTDPEFAGKTKTPTGGVDPGLYQTLLSVAAKIASNALHQDSASAGAAHERVRTGCSNA